MIQDILTVLWKEVRELPWLRGGRRGGWVGLLVFIGVFGVLMPLQTGVDWVTSTLSLFYWAWLPFSLVGSIIADSFAGERERRTLETLLASRLSDRAILFGKIAAGILYGTLLTWITILLGLITVNVVHGQGLLIFYSWQMALATLLTPVLVSWLGSGLGVLVSLRAASVRQAQQTFSYIYLVLFIPLIILPMLPVDILEGVFTAVSQWNADLFILVAFLAVVLLDVVLALLALARFQRRRLILD